MMGILHTFQTANSPKGQLPPPVGSWQVINWLETVWKKKVHPKVAGSSAPLAKYILSQQKSFNLPVQFNEFG